MSAELPTGTVTLLFTDIEGSTKLLHELGERYAETLAEHRGALRSAFTRHGGVEVDTQGDAFFVAFARASDAVAAAAEAQRALATGPVRVRMGLHTGEPLRTEEGYVGMDVHRAARIMGAGHGGQVLLSQTTRDLLDAAIELRDLGEHRLKDLSGPQRLYQLGSNEFPPLKTLYRTNLPAQTTPLVGRERELTEAGELLRNHRLLTLTGPGGSGKTRLALQLAADIAEDFNDGVFWVPLQAIREPELVLPAIAQAIGVQEELLEFVGDKRMLLLLDNLEQVLQAAPHLAELVAATTNAKLLTTSREPLRVTGEQRYAVEPLASSAAVELFVDRARAVESAFRRTAAVTQICRRLDGLPLAIELAAARVSLLPPEALLRRLERALPVLTGGARDAPERQRTLRATIEWSYELASPDEQKLFGRLSVFAGSFSLEAAERVCEADLEMLHALVEKSLIRRWESGRLGMLETIHEFASERLEQSLEADETRRRHAEFFLGLAKSARLTADAEGTERHDLVDPEQENLRAALDWSDEAGEIELGLALAVALEQHWATHLPEEGLRRALALLERGADVSPLLRAHALRMCGGMNDLSGGDPARSERLYGEGLALYRRLGDERGIAIMLHRLSIHARGDPTRARELAEESLRIFQRIGYPRGECQALAMIAAVEVDTGNEELGVLLAERSAAIAASAGFVWYEARIRAWLADLALAAARPDEAEPHVRETLALARRMGDRFTTLRALLQYARLAGQRGDLERAGCLWGAVEAERARKPLGGWGSTEAAAHSSYLVGLLGDPQFRRGHELGRSLPLSEAATYAAGEQINGPS
jgi:predicted ATPase/class 3 adenylate cyclase